MDNEQLAPKTIVSEGPGHIARIDDGYFMHKWADQPQGPKPPRIRTNRSTTSKGVPSYDLTFESEGLSDYPQDKLDADIAEHLRRFDELTKEMEQRTAPGVD